MPGVLSALLAVSVVGNPAPDAPVVVGPAAGGGLALSNGLVRLEVRPRTQAAGAASDDGLLRFFTLDPAPTEVLRSFHADPDVDSPLYSQGNVFAGYRILLHDHLRYVRAGNASTAAEGSLVLEAGRVGVPCLAVEDNGGSNLASQPPPRGSNCSVLGSATMTVTLRAGARAFDVNVTAVIGEPSSNSSWIEYVLASFQWARPDPPTFVHTPHLKRVSTQHWGHAPSTEYVSADRTFNSPVSVFEGLDGSGVALVVDTQQLNEHAVDAPGARPVSGKQNMRWVPNATFAGGKYVHPTFPAGFDVQIDPPVGPGHAAVLSFGMLDYMAEQHVYFKHHNDGSMVRLVQSDRLQFAFELQLAPRTRGDEDNRQQHAPEGPQEQRLFQRAARRAWNRTGSAELRRGRPQVMPFVQYAALCYPAALNASSPVGGPVGLTQPPAFVSWKLPDGSMAGGLRTMAGGPDPNSVVFDKIHNVFWWNNQHMATGFGLWGKELVATGEGPAQLLGRELLRAAELTLNLTLSAPLTPGSGLWDSVCTWSPTGCTWTGGLHKIAAPHTPECEGNPKCDPGYTGAYWDFGSDWKSASSVSKTAVMLLRYYTDVHADARILPRVKLHADWLVNLAASANGLGRVAEWWAPLGPPPPPPPSPIPPAPPPAPPAPPAPQGAFTELGNLDPNGIHPTGPFHVASEQACQAICFATTSPPCHVGVFLNGTVRYGECWLGSKQEPPRRDFCGAKPGQSCAAFARVLTPSAVAMASATNKDTNGSLSPVGWLAFNAHGGVHLQVLADFAKQLSPGTERARYETAARTIAQQLIQEILPDQRWADVETFYSCSNKPESAFDNFTHQFPRNTLSTGWAIDGLTSMWELTGEAQYLRAAEEAADYASLYQAAYEPTYIDRPKIGYVFGGMRSQNTDAEWVDMRQAVISEGLMRLGNASGRQDLMERGVAAARASLSLLTEPRTQANNYPVPNLDPSAGRPHVSNYLEPENIDHEGLPQVCVRVCP